MTIWMLITGVAALVAIPNIGLWRMETGEERLAGGLALREDAEIEREVARVRRKNFHKRRAGRKRPAENRR
jgi:hypothetical protein